MTQSGRIRFVGGPKHNTFECCNWIPHINVIVEPEDDDYFKYLSGAPAILEPLETTWYQLQTLWSPYGAVYLEYHHRGAANHVLSGADGSMRPL